jgi:hypothetical protein
MLVVPAEEVDCGEGALFVAPALPQEALMNTTTLSNRRAHQVIALTRKKYIFITSTLECRK